MVTFLFFHHTFLVTLLSNIWGTCHFENHIFWNEWGNAHPEISRYFNNGTHPNQWFCYLEAGCDTATGDNGWRKTNGLQTERYQALERAKNSNAEAAYRSISVGGPQIMGFNYGDLDYNNATDMFNAFSQNEFNQVKGFFDYMKNHTTCKRRLDDSRLCQLDSEGNKIWATPLDFAHTGQEDWYQLAAVYNGDANKEALYQQRYQLAKEILNP